MIDELIAAGRYEDALRLLKDSKDENHVYQKILCLYSLKRYNEARVECEILKEYAEKNYYDVIAIYVTILIEMDSLEEAKHVLEEELSMPYIPGKYEKIFNETYDELLKRGRENSKSINIFDTISDEDLAAQLLSQSDKEIIFMLLDQLNQRNIRRILPALEEYLSDVSKPRIFKTIIIESLASQNVDQFFILKDENEEIEINPCHTTPLMNQVFINKIYFMFENITMRKDISFLEYCMDVLVSYAGNIYPNEVEDDKINLVACSIAIYVDSMMGSNNGYEEKLIQEYHLDEKEVNDFLLTLEKIMIL